MKIKHDSTQVLVMLKVMYSRWIGLLDTFFDEFLFPSEWIFLQYEALCMTIEGLLDIPGISFLEDFKKKYRRPLESLRAIPEEYDEVWNGVSRPKAVNLLGSLDRPWIEAGGPKCEIPEIIEFIAEFDKNIFLYEEQKKQYKDNLFKEIEEKLLPPPGVKLETNNKIVQEKQPEPIPITIVGDVRIRGLEEKVILQKPKNKKIQLRKFPPDTKWQDITIKFLNGQEVIVKVKNLTRQTTYAEMGFQDEKKKLPNKQWAFLELLAVQNGELSWGKNRNLSLEQRTSAKKKKQLLAETLRAYFQIDEDPFYDYKKEKAYKIKMKLIPEESPEE